jgi:hypothetical protein
VGAGRLRRPLKPNLQAIALLRPFHGLGFELSRETSTCSLLLADRVLPEKDSLSRVSSLFGAGSVIRALSSYSAHPTAELRLYTVQRGDTALPTIKNTTKKPLSVPLPGGKRLFLGPGKEGQIRARADEHPAVAALVEAGELEIVPDSGKSGGKGRGGGSTSGGQGRNPTSTVFKSGDG